MLIKRILSELNIESDIITDVYYYEKNDKFLKNHIICIGSGNSNKVTKDYEMREKSGLNRNETTTKIFVDDDRNIAFVYGRGVKETYEATRDFCKYNLKYFLDNWSDKYTKNKKNINIPINLDGVLKNVVYTPLGTVSNDLKVDKLSKELKNYKFYFIISVSILLSMLCFLITFYKYSADFWVSLGISFAVVFGIPTMYSIYPRRSI